MKLYLSDATGTVYPAFHSLLGLLEINANYFCAKEFGSRKKRYYNQLVPEKKKKK